MRRALAFACAAVILTACGGGGGGGSSPTPLSTPNTGPAPIQSTSVQRAVANQALAVPSAAGSIYTAASVTGAASARHIMDAARHAMSGWRAGASGVASPQGLRRLSSVTYSACSNGVETAGNEVSQTEAQVYERIFYDAACAHLYQDIFLDLVATSSTAASATGTDTYYTSSGQVYDYTTLSLAITETASNTGTISLLGTDAPSPTAAQTAAIGVACSINSNAIGCGFGGVAHVASASQDLGDTLSFNATISSAANSTTLAMSGTDTSFAGSLNTLSLSAGTFPNWVVSGGSTVDNASFTASLTYTTSGNLTTMTLTLTDAVDDASVSISASGTPAVITGTVKQTSTGQTVATFTTDASGNGTITYSNGTTATITNWVVQG